VGTVDVRGRNVCSAGGSSKQPDRAGAGRLNEHHGPLPPGLLCLSDGRCSLVCEPSARLTGWSPGARGLLLGLRYLLPRQLRSMPGGTLHRDWPRLVDSGHHQRRRSAGRTRYPRRCVDSIPGHCPSRPRVRMDMESAPWQQCAAAAQGLSRARHALPPASTLAVRSVLGQSGQSGQIRSGPTRVPVDVQDVAVTIFKPLAGILGDEGRPRLSADPVGAAPRTRRRRSR